jgi:hypothetical protein
VPFLLLIDPVKPEELPRWASAVSRGNAVPVCLNCGMAITRGSRARQLADLGAYPEDMLCLACLTDSISSDDAAEMLRGIVWEQVRFPTAAALNSARAAGRE